MGTKSKKAWADAVQSMGIGAVLCLVIIGWPANDADATTTVCQEVANHQASGYPQSDRLQLLAGLRESVEVAGPQIQEPFENLMTSVRSPATEWEHSEKDLIVACYNTGWK